MTWGNMKWPFCSHCPRPLVSSVLWRNFGDDEGSGNGNDNDHDNENVNPKYNFLFSQHFRDYFNLENFGRKKNLPSCALVIKKAKISSFHIGVFTFCFFFSFTTPLVLWIKPVCFSWVLVAVPACLLQSSYYLCDYNSEFPSLRTAVKWCIYDRQHIIK